MYATLTERLDQSSENPLAFFILNLQIGSYTCLNPGINIFFNLRIKLMLNDTSDPSFKRHKLYLKYAYKDMFASAHLLTK